jgi:ACS family hexuronate transporter-like MFS transporter
MTLVSTLSYIDRQTLSLLIPTIRAETGLTQEQYGWVVSAFSVAYMIGNPAWGYWIDRIGLRRGMLAAVALWTVASASHAWAAGFLSFALLRAALGFGEGATFPGALRTVVQTLPPNRRAFGTALSYSGGSTGAIVTPLLMTPVAVWLGWRGGFLFTGLLGLAWMLGWFVLSRRPDIRAVPVVAQSAGDVRLDWRDNRLWAFLAVYALGAVPLGFVLYFGGLFLSFRFGLTQADLGRLLWIPPLGWETGYLFWGWISDRAGQANLGRLMGIAAVLSLSLMAAPLLSSLPLLMMLLFVAMFMTSGFIIPSISYATRVFPSRNTALIGGLGAGSFGVVTALTAPVFGRLFDSGAHASAFVAAALVPSAGFLIWRGLTRRPDGPRAAA